MARQAARVAFLRDLRKQPCTDCGELFEPHQMDFDHRDPEGKAFGLTSSQAMLSSRDKILAEVAKCDVVCAVCHRIRTQHLQRKALDRIKVRGSSRYLDRKQASWRAHARLLDALRDVPCVDCGRRFPPCAMDFDHRDPNTSKGVSRA